MSSKHPATSLVFLSAAVSLSACIVENPFIRGDGDTDQSGDSGDSGDTTTGDGDGDNTTGDGDGDTTTGDGDGDTTTGDGDGDTTGDGDGDTTGDGDGEPQTCTRRLWTFDFESEQWTSVGLDAAWTGPNAPPCDTEIQATTYLEPWDQLLVFSSDGNYYRRDGNSWDLPVLIEARFPQLNELKIDSLVYVPAVNQSESGLLFNSLPNAYIYEIYESGDAVHTDTVVIMDEPSPGPNQSDDLRYWSLVMSNPDLYGTAPWWTSWQGFDNGRLYRVDGAFTWTNWPQNNNPLFSGAPGQPELSTIEAAWGDFDLQRGYFIEP